MPTIQPNTRRWIVAALFLVMFIAGLLVTPDYGMPWDELTEIRTLGSNVREYVGLVRGEQNEPKVSATGIEFPDASENVDMDHGQSVYYPFSPLLFVTFGDGGARTIMLLWHGYTFLIFLLGVFALYKIAAFLFKDWKYGIVAALFLYLSPRFFAEGHYNNKDVMAMSMILLCLWFFIRFLETRKLGSALLFALFSAICTNMRISGLFFFGLLGLLYLVVLSVKKEWSWKALLLGLSMILSFVVFYFVLTPGMWKAPFEFIKYVFARSSNFSDWPGYVFYLGRTCRPVPWHYIPVMIALTTPPFIVALMLFGFGSFFFAAFRQKAVELFSGYLRYLLVCVAYVVVFLGFAMIRQPILYDNWRHFYFLYGPLLLLAVFGLQQLIQLLHGKWKFLAIGTVSAQILAMLLIVCLSHPFQFVYFNKLAGSDPASKFDMDYWNVSQAQALMRLVDTVDSDEQISVTSTDWYTGDGLDKAYKILSASYQSRIRLIFVGYYQIARGADYLMVNPRGLQICSDKTLEPRQDWIFAYGLQNYLDSLQKVVSLTAFGSEFMTIYQMP
ncbi:MAG: glycosyltransferase family 39 protein [Christensenella sp.]|nr:glycosyltransferase family 39 protein [Christensenella sp.]